MEELNPYLFAESCGSKLCLSLYKNFSAAFEKTALNVNFPASPLVKYPNCIKITQVGKREKSNFGINIVSKSQNLYTATIDSISTNRSSTSNDDYVNCLNGYITISPVSMCIQKEKRVEELRKVKF